VLIGSAKLRDCIMLGHFSKGVKGDRRTHITTHCILQRFYLTTNIWISLLSLKRLGKKLLYLLWIVYKEIIEGDGSFGAYVNRSCS